MSEAPEDFQVGFDIFSSQRGRGCCLGLVRILGSSCYQVPTGTVALAAIPGERACTRPSQTWPVVFGVPLGLSGGFSRCRWKCLEINNTICPRLYRSSFKDVPQFSDVWIPAEHFRMSVMSTNILIISLILIISRRKPGCRGIYCLFSLASFPQLGPFYG